MSSSFTTKAYRVQGGGWAGDGLGVLGWSVGMEVGGVGGFLLRVLGDGVLGRGVVGRG